MPYNALIVDDSQVARSMIRKALSLSGVEIGEVHEAGNGRDAITVLEAAWVDIVFADLNMPVMNGSDMLDEMARRKLLKSTPVVIISTERSKEMIEALAAKGAQAYLTKPFTPEALKDIIEQLLVKGGQTRAEPL
jgi:two-component system chemotaxis response regulator CheY